MRTVPTLCASGAGIGISALGLSLVTDDHHHDPFVTRKRPLFSRSRASTPHRDMSATTTTTTSAATTTNNSTTAAAAAIFTLTPAAPPKSSYASTTPEQLRRAAPHARLTRSVSENATLALKRDREPRASLSPATEAAIPAGLQGEAQLDIYTPPQRGWLRRLSSNMSSSRDSSRAPTSRPGSAYLSHSNGSATFSNAGSTTPIFSASSPHQLPPNKLVKRSASTHSANSSPTTSRLPLPVFKRPATSHQRSSLMQDHSPDARPSTHMSRAHSSDSTRDSQWRHYFTPKIAREEASTRGRPATSIPNPIKRVYPDRRYRPTLVSGRESTRRASVEFDDGLSSKDDSLLDSRPRMATSVASSPIFTSTPTFEQAQTAKRSFSIGDLLSTGPQPLWKQSASKDSTLRRTRRKLSSASRSDMGSSFSTSSNDFERPNKRRGLFSGSTPSRSIYSSSSATTRPSGEANSQENQVDPTTKGTASIASKRSLPTEKVQPTTSRSSSIEHRKIPSTSSFTPPVQRQFPLSGGTPEVTAGADSDGEQKSFGGTSIDSQSDAIFDSIPTRTTNSSSGRRGPPIDTIFNDTPPAFSSGRSTKLKDFLTQDTYPGNEHAHRYSTIEEEESIATPVRTSHDTSARAGSLQLFNSSPPVMREMREMPDPDEIDWDAPDEDRGTPLNGGLDGEASETPPINEMSLPFRFAPRTKTSTPVSSTSTPQRNGIGNPDRASIFDWAEVQPSPSHNNSPPRPRTVHGKKDPENRASRPPGRRAPSGMHARSHSVPVVPDAEGKRSSAVANKFGTWGVGSKAVTEDWNEDFDFEEEPLTVAESVANAEKRIDSGHEIFVPRSIREQQDNIVANIGLLREWGLLIEELKELRIRAVALNMLKGPFARDWGEVDAMIELADQESEEQTLEPRRSPPSSPGFDYAAFEESLPDIPTTANGRAQSIVILSEPLVPPPVLIAAEDVSKASAIIGRPRKDSEAVARSVIEALQVRRSVSDSATLKPVPTARKVPFDTATLRHIVPYVNGLKRRVKDALRETEGLYTSPRRGTKPEHGTEESDEPSFRAIFQPDSPLVNRRSRPDTRDNADLDDFEGFEDF